MFVNLLVSLRLKLILSFGNLKSIPKNTSRMFLDATKRCNEEEP